MARRFKPQPPIKMSFWKRDGKFWYAEPSDIQEAIARSGVPEKLIRERMGAGYHYIQDILEGKRLEGWSIAHIEWGLSPKIKPASTPHSWPLRGETE
jgi:hypothetical protein